MRGIRFLFFSFVTSLVLLLLVACGSGSSSTNDLSTTQQEERKSEVLVPSESLQTFIFLEGLPAFNSIMDDAVFAIVNLNNDGVLRLDTYRYELSVTRGNEEVKDLFAWAKMDGTSGSVLMDGVIQSGETVIERLSADRLHRTVVFARQPDDADVGEYSIRATITDVADGDTGNILASVSQDYRVMIENVYEPPRLVAHPSAPILGNVTIKGERSVALPSGAVFEWDEWNLPSEMAANYTLRARYRAHIEPLVGGRAEVLLATRPDTGIEERGLLRGGDLSGLGVRNQSAGWTDYYVELVRADDRASLPSGVRLFASDYNEGSRHNVTVSVVATGPGASSEAFDLGGGSASTALLLYKAAYPEDYDRANVSLAAAAGIMNRESLVQPGVMPQARSQIRLTVATPDLFTTNGLSSLSDYFSVSAMDPVVAYPKDLSALEASQIGETYGVYVDNETLGTISLAQLGASDGSDGIVSLPIWIGDRQVDQGYALEVARCSELGSNCGEMWEELIRVDSIERLDDAPTLVDWQARAVAGQSQIELLLNVSDRDALEFSSGRAGLTGSFVPATEEASSISINATDPCVFEVQERALSREGLHAGAQTLGLRLEATAGSASGTCAMNDLVEGVYSVALAGLLNVTLVDAADDSELVANTGSIADFGDSVLLNYSTDRVARLLAPSSQSYGFFENVSAFSNALEDGFFTIMDRDFVVGGSPDIYQYNLSVTRGGEAIDDLFVWAAVDEDGQAREDSRIVSGEPIAERSLNGGLNRTVVFARQPDDADVGEYRIRATITDIADDGTGNILASVSQNYSVMIENVYEPPRLVALARPSASILDDVTITGERSVALPSDAVFEWDEWNLPSEMAANYTLRARYRAHIEPLAGGHAEVLLATRPDIGIAERGLLRGGGLSGLGVRNQSAGWTDYYVELVRASDQASLPNDITLFASDYNEGSRHNVTVSLVATGPGASSEAFDLGGESASSVLPLYAANYLEDYDRADVSLAADAGIMNRESLVQPGVMPQARNQINLTVATPDLFTTNGLSSLSQYFSVSAMDPAVAYADDLSALEAPQIGETYGVYVDNNKTLGDISLANSAATSGIVFLPIWIGDRQVNQGYSLEVARCSAPGNCEDREVIASVPSIERLDDAPTLVAWRAQTVAGQSQIELLLNVSDRDTLEFPSGRAGLAGSFVPATEAASSISINATDPCVFEVQARELSREGLDARTQTLGLRLEATAGSASGTCALNDLVEGVYSVALDGRLNVTLVDNTNDSVLVANTGSIADFGDSVLLNYSTDRVARLLAPPSRSYGFLESVSAFSNALEDDFFTVMDRDFVAGGSPDIYQYNLSVTRGGEAIEDLFVWAEVDENGQVRENSRMIASGEPIAERSSNGGLNRTVVFARQPDDADVGEYRIRATITDVADDGTGNILASVSQNYSVMIENVYEPPRLVARPSASILGDVTITGERSVALPSNATFEWDEWNLPAEMAATYTLRARYRAHIESLEGGRAEVLLATRPDTGIAERGLLRGGGLSGLGVRNQSAGWTDYYVELVRADDQASLPSDVTLFASDYNEGSRHNVTVSAIATGLGASSEAVEFDLGDGSASTAFLLYKAAYPEDYDRANVSLAAAAGILNRESLVQPGVVSQARSHINLMVATPDLFTTNGVSFLSDYFSVLAVNPAVAYAEDLSALMPPQIGETYGVYVDNERLETISLAQLGASGERVALPIWIGDRQVNRGYTLEVARCSELGSNCGDTREELIRVDSIERLDDAPTLVDWQAQAVAGQSQIELLLNVSDRDALEFSSGMAGLAGAFVPATEAASLISINATDPCVFEVQARELTREGLDAGTQTLGLRLEVTAGSASGTCALNDLVEGVYSVALDGRLNVTLVDDANNDELVANTGSIADFGDSVLLNYRTDRVARLLAPPSQSYGFLEGVAAFSNALEDDFFTIMDRDFVVGGSPDIYQYNLSVTRGGEMGEAIDDLFVWAEVDENGQAREDSRITSGESIAERSSNGGLNRTVIFARQPDDADVGEYRIRATITDIADDGTGNILASVSQNYSVMIENVYEPPRLVARLNASILGDVTITGERSVALPSNAVFEWDEWNLPAEMAATYTLQARYRAHIEPLAGGRAEVLLATKPDIGIEERGLLRGGGLSGLGVRNQSAEWTDYYVELVRADDRASLPSDITLFASDYNEGSRHNVTVSVVASGLGASTEAFDLGGGSASTALLLYQAAYLEDYDRADVSLAADVGIMNRESLVQPGVVSQARSHIRLMVTTPDLFTTNGVSSLSQYFSVVAVDPAVAYADDLSALEAPQIGETYGVYVDNERLQTISLAQLGESGRMVSLPIWIGDRQVNKGYSLEVARCSELGSNCGETREELIQVDSIERLNDPAHLISLFELNDGTETINASTDAQSARLDGEVEVSFAVRDLDVLETVDSTTGAARDNVVLKGVFTGEMSLVDNILFPPLPCSFDEVSFEAAQTAALTDASRELTLRARTPLCHNGMLPPDNDGQGREYFLNFGANSELRVTIETTDGSRPAYVENIPTDTIRNIPDLLQPFLYFRDDYDHPMLYAESVNVRSLPRVFGNTVYSIRFASNMPITSSWALHSEMLSLDDNVSYLVNDRDGGIPVFPGQVWDLFIKEEDERYSEVPPAEISNSYRFRRNGRVLFEGIAPPRDSVGIPTIYTLQDVFFHTHNKYYGIGIRPTTSGGRNPLEQDERDQYDTYIPFIWLWSPDEPRPAKRGKGSYYFVEAANNATHFIRFAPQVMSGVDHSFLMENLYSREEIDISVQVCDFPIDKVIYDGIEGILFRHFSDFFPYRDAGRISCPAGRIPAGFLQDGELMEDRLVGLLSPDDGESLNDPPLVQLSDLLINAEDLPPLSGEDDIDAIRVPLNITLNLRNDLLPSANGGRPKDYLINILLTDRSGSISSSGFVVRITSLHP